MNKAKFDDECFVVRKVDKIENSRYHYLDPSPPWADQDDRGKSMEMPEVLEKIGLTPKQAGVYLALLELGTASVQSISGKAGVKRPTTYLILEDLQQKGLVSVVPRAKKHLFTAESPELLVSQLGRREELLRRFLPNLLAIYNARKEKPQVQLFSGREGVKEIYQMIFESPEVWFFGTVAEVEKIYPEGLRQFVKRVAELKIKARDLLSRTPDDYAYAAQVQINENYQIRFIPEGSGFPSDSAIFGDRVVFFSFRPEIFAVLVKSRAVSQSLRTLYELAWQKAEPLPRSAN